MSAARHAFVALGSNLGDRRATLRHALSGLEATPGVQVVACSRFIETDPVGGPPQGKFLNAACELWTNLAPRRLLDVLLAIERGLGRVRTVPNGPRTIDLDLLFVDDLVIDEPGLIVPHPRIAERRFVLEPLAEIAPSFRHPVTRRTVAEMLASASAAESA